MPHLNPFFKKISKLSITSVIFVLFIMFGTFDSEKISAQMPPQMPPNMGPMGGGPMGGGPMGGGPQMGAMGMENVKSNCRNNPGTGEVFCELEMDISMMSMTQTSAPWEYYEGQGVWFEGCMIPGQNYENYEAAWIERNYVTETADHNITSIMLRGNMPYEPKQQYAKCKFHFFTVDSPLVKPGGPYHNPQWEADQETQKMYQEADNIRRDAERQRAEEELLRAKQQAELDAQMAEEMRKQQAQQQPQQGNNQGIGNIFGQGPVGNIFGGNQFQPPPDQDVPIGPFINLTVMTAEDRWGVMDCVANGVEKQTGMNYEQAYMDFAFPLGVRMLEEPDFYHDVVTGCMHLSFSKLISGGWGEDNQRNNPQGVAPREYLNAMMEACIVPYLSDTMNIPRNVIMDDMVNVENGKRSVSREEMLATYDCWEHKDQHLQGPNPDGYFPLEPDRLVTYLYGDQEIQGQACMIDSVTDSIGNRQQAERVVGDLVNFAVGRSEQWGFMESDANPQHKNEVVNRVIGCNQELNWLKDYLQSVTGGGSEGNFAMNFEVLGESFLRDCIVGRFIGDVGFTDYDANEQYDMIHRGLLEFQDPTEFINRPLGEDQYRILTGCADGNDGGGNLPMEAWDPFLQQYTVFFDNYSWENHDQGDGMKKTGERMGGCIAADWKRQGTMPGVSDRDRGNFARDVMEAIFFRGGYLKPNREERQQHTLSRDSAEVVFSCLNEEPAFEWIRASINDPNFNYEPEFESDIFTDKGNVEKTATDFRQTIQTNPKEQGPANMQSGSLSGGGALDNMRVELVDLARNSGAEDCMVANLARAKGETENYIKTSYITNIVWEPSVRPTNKEKAALENCESQIRSATQGKGGLSALLKLGSFGDPDYLDNPNDTQRACMIQEYVKTFGYMLESSGVNPQEAAAKAVSEFSMPGAYDGFHPLLGEKAPNLRPASAIELDAIYNCKLVDLYVYEGSRLRKLIPGVDTSELPIGDLASPTGLAIMGIMITLFFSVLQMIRGK